MLSITYILIILCTVIFKAIVYLFLAFVILVVAVKIWADPIKAVCKCSTKLNGKVALVTGGNAGIGLETARDLARRGARVIIASRNTEKSKAAVADIIKTTGNSQVEYRHLDLSKFSNIKEFAEDFNRTVPRLNILVNNAGLASTKPRITEDGIPIVMQVNYFGAVLLTNLLLDKLIASRPSRIVVVSSLAHRTVGFNPDDIAGLEAHRRKASFWTFYGRSKACQIMWTKALAKRLPLGVTINSLHPGIVQTEIFNKMPARYLAVLKFILNILFKNSKEGAQTVIHLCVSTEVGSHSGGYYANCRPSSVAKVCKNDAVIEKVWNESQVLTKIA